MAFLLRRNAAANQGQEGLESGPVGPGTIELDSGGKQSRLMEALKAFSLAVSRLSCSVSLLTRKMSLSIGLVLPSIRFIRHSCCILRCSLSGSQRQWSVAPKWRAALHEYDNINRHRGSDEGDAPLLVELEDVATDRLAKRRERSMALHLRSPWPQRVRRPPLCRAQPLAGGSPAGPGGKEKAPARGRGLKE